MSGHLFLLFLSLTVWPSPVSADACGDAMVECYTGVYRDCGGLAAKNEDPCVVAGFEACARAVECGTNPCVNCQTDEPPATVRRAPVPPPPPPPPPPPVAQSYPGTIRIQEKIHMMSNCAPWRDQLRATITAAVDRFEACLNYGHVRPELAERMVRALSEGDGIMIKCQEPPSSHWCAAGGFGDVWFSPSRALNASGICHPEIGSFFIHEVAHSAGLSTASGHNEQGESTERDEVYSLQRYCMNTSRMWIGRARRTGDVVASDRLACVRAYQELTPSTLEDPFWLAMRRKAQRGQDPCAPPLPRP
ncbi:MAG: hypothetical protein IT285_07245 [Bdellovibrionales bacterium]|nr:hypothetical protein [Bdellovibrionales bacterium]